MEPMVDGSIEPVLNSATYAVVLLVVFVTIYYWLLRRIGQSPFGRVLKAIREDEQVANALGKNTASFKIKSFMVGCALMGLAGILWQFRQGAVTPTAFRPRITFFVWVALIIGGAGSNTGSILGGAIFAAVLFQGPRYVKNVINNTIQLPNAPRTFAEAMGPLLDPLLVADSQLLSAVPVLLFLSVAFGTIYGAMWLSRNRRTEITERVGATVDGYPDVRDGLARAASTVGLTTDRQAWVKRGIWLVGIAAFFLVWGLLTLAGGDAEPFFAYALSEINALQLVIMGLVLVVIVQVRPEGLLGHRKETAAGVRLLDAEGRAIRPKKATTDGGEEE
jgi:branched-subunit amino acid ABC-type transport system permease component